MIIYGNELLGNKSHLTQFDKKGRRYLGLCVAINVIGDAFCYHFLKLNYVIFFIFNEIGLMEK